jgi:hypothetical protein
VGGGKIPSKQSSLLELVVLISIHLYRTRGTALFLHCPLADESVPIIRITRVSPLESPGGAVRNTSHHGARSPNLHQVKVGT